MRRKLTIGGVAALLIALCVPASAADLPVYGTKNFTPDAATPSYLSRENGSPPIGSADRAAVESDVNDTAEAGPAEPRAHHSSRAKQSGHGKSVAAGKSSRHHASAKSHSRATHSATKKTNGGTRTASSRKSAAQTRTAQRSASPGKAKAAKSGKAAKHHAASRTPTKSVRTSLAKNN